MSCRLSIYNDTPEDAIISDLFVPENCRNQGLGSEILKYCEKFAKEQGCESISLRSDNDDWVREWYKRLGFEVESSQVWLKKFINMEAQPNFQLPPYTSKEQTEHSLEELIADPFATRTVINAINQGCAKIDQTLAETIKKVY